MKGRHLNRRHFACTAAKIVPTWRDETPPARGFHRTFTENSWKPGPETPETSVKLLIDWHNLVVSNTRTIGQKRRNSCSDDAAWHATKATECQQLLKVFPWWHGVWQMVFPTSQHHVVNILLSLWPYPPYPWNHPGLVRVFTAVPVFLATRFHMVFRMVFRMVSRWSREASADQCRVAISSGSQCCSSNRPYLLTREMVSSFAQKPWQLEMILIRFNQYASILGMRWRKSSRIDLHQL